MKKTPEGNHARLVRRDNGGRTVSRKKDWWFELVVILITLVAVAVLSRVAEGNDRTRQQQEVWYASCMSIQQGTNNESSHSGLGAVLNQHSLRGVRVGGREVARRQRV